jgi:dTMP kinase
MNSKGRLIIIEGGDGSGKATQSARLVERLTAEGHAALRITFPNYESPSSALIKMYLGGDFGDSAEAVNPYVASTFYTVDRFASYTTAWKAAYEAGTVIIADRYTTSNLVHQGAKIEEPGARHAYFKWLQEFEYSLFGLPKPDAVIFLDVPPAVSRQWMADRSSKMDGTDQKDIHERDQEHLDKAYRTAQELCDLENWIRVAAVEADRLMGVEEIHERVWAVVDPLMKQGRGGA